MEGRPRLATKGDKGRAEGRTVHTIVGKQPSKVSRTSPHRLNYLEGTRQRHLRLQGQSTPRSHNRSASRHRQNKNRSRAQSWSNRAKATSKRLQFKHGSGLFLDKISPNHQQLSTYHNNDDLVFDSHLYRGETYDFTHSTQMTMASSNENVEMNRTLALLSEGGTGFLPTHKPSGYIRLMFENWNSLGIFTHSWKIDRINYLIKRHQIDIVAGCESQCNWTKVPRHKKLTNIISPGYTKQYQCPQYPRKLPQRSSWGYSDLRGWENM